jgi:hypothetical protein
LVPCGFFAKGGELDTKNEGYFAIVDVLPLVT